jgi:DNA polymerase III delta prime subunit
VRLTECTLSLDALTGTRTLRLNGEAYDLERVPGGWRFCRRVKPGKPRPAWVVQEGRCDCPHRVFRGQCKHEKSAQLLDTLSPGAFMPVKFEKATKHSIRLRLAFIGPSGSGKTYTALAVATHLLHVAELSKQGNGRIALIDSERGSAAKYADLFDFDTLSLETFAPATYVEAIHAAEQAGYPLIVIDSLTHAWTGKEGALEQVDKEKARKHSANSFDAWRTVTPMHNALVDAMITSASHVIATMRVKTEYVVETNDKGKAVPRKVGLAPIQRDGLEYEFDVIGDMDNDNRLVVSKTRCSALSGAVIEKPGAELAATLAGWLKGDGTPAAVPARQQTAKASPLPKGAANLLARVQATDAKLAKEGLCEPGALLEWLKTQCEGEGYPLDLLQWKPDQFEDAVKLVKRFEAKCREQRVA